MEQTRRTRARKIKTAEEKANTQTAAPADDQITQYYQELCRSCEREFGWAPELARRLANHAISTLRNMFQGETLYITKRKKTDCAAIKREFEAGKTVSALALDHNLSERQIRRIIMNGGP